jgi:hypothetical protein
MNEMFSWSEDSLYREYFSRVTFHSSMPKAFSVLFILLLVFQNSCTEKRSSVTENRLERIQVKIDNGSYEESISELNEILKKEPENQKARAILGSVYVRRAGIAVKDYFTIHGIFTEPMPEEPDVFEMAPAVDLLSKDEKLKVWIPVLEKINTGAKQLKQINRKFTQIPDISEESAQDIYLALLELEKIEKPTNGNHLYRGIIKLIYFKYLVSHQKLIPMGERKLCSLRIFELSDRAEMTKNYMVDMILDLSFGFPNEKAELEELAQNIEKPLNEVVRFLKNYGNQNQMIFKVLQTEGLQCVF